MSGSKGKVWLSAVVAVGTMLVLSACSSDAAAPMDARNGRQPGILQLLAWAGPTPTMVLNGGAVRWNHAPATTDVAPPQVIEVPDTVEAGRAFDITVYTVGPSGCWQAAGQDVLIGGRVIELKPWDTHSGSDICTGVLLFLPHPTTVTLSAPGEWTVRVTGRRVRHTGWENLELLQPVEAEKTIYVR